MKKIIIAIVVMLFAYNASAQYNRFEAAFVAANLKYDDGEFSETQNPKGAELGFIHGFGLSKSMPLFLEVGGRLQFLHLNEDEGGDYYDDDDYDYRRYYDDDDYYYGKFVNKSDDEDEDISLNVLNLSVLVVATYKFDITDKFSIAPQFGFNLKFNLVAKWKEEFDGESESYSWFDEDEFDETAKRFQFGLNAGVGFSFSKFYLGYRFQPDLSEFVKDYKTNANVITLGINF